MVERGATDDLSPIALSASRREKRIHGVEGALEGRDVGRVEGGCCFERRTLKEPVESAAGSRNLSACSPAFR